MRIRPAIRPGLYAIADTSRLAHGRFEAAVEAALAGGAVMVQYRDKTADAPRRAREARALVQLCRAYNAVSIVNDDAELATETDADGVHVGGDDAAPAAVRARLGSGRLIGVSCYNELDRARRAAAAGADYVAFGSVYPSPTKPRAVRAPLSLLGAAREEIGLPVCAIGGITAARGAELVAAGASLLAVIDDLFSAGDITARARAYARLFGDNGKDRRTTDEHG